MPRHLGLHGAFAAAMPAASRHLASLHDHGGGAIAAAVPAAAAFLAVCALALALCASHSGAGAAATERLKRALASVSRRRTDPVIVSIHRVQPGFGLGGASGVDASPPPCVWQKGILMGGKCQLPDFSGVINYDPAGNMVAPGRPRAQPLPALGW